MRALVSGGVAALLVGVMPAQAQEMRSAEAWCREAGDARQGARACDVREYTIATASVAVDAGRNGGVRVVGGSRSDTLVRARVVAMAETQADAEALAREVRIGTDGGRVSATGPDRASGRRGWHVSFEVWVPTRADVTAKTANGGISIADVSGTVGFEAVNGGVTLSRVGGDVRGQTVNGGVHVELAGERWNGKGLEARTTNGGVRVKVPEAYSCQLAVSTVNGRVRTDFPLTVQGHLDRSIDLPLGQGGAPVRIVTTNGGVHLTR